LESLFFNIIVGFLVEAQGPLPLKFILYQPCYSVHSWGCHWPGVSTHASHRRVLLAKLFNLRVRSFEIADAVADVDGSLLKLIHPQLLILLMINILLLHLQIVLLGHQW